MKMKVKIEVCERSADYWLEPKFENGVCIGFKQRPKYHVQIKDRPELWACGKSIDDAIGNLIRTHSKHFSVHIDFLGKQSR